MKNFKKIIALVVISFCTHSLIALTDGQLDASFNGTGLSVLLDADSNVKAVAIQVDGKIIAAGSSDIHGKNSFLISRYNTDGTLDKSFGYNGQVMTRFGVGESYSCANAVVLQEDGKIIAAGVTNAVKNNRWCLARYNTDGSLDESFFGGRAIFKGTVISFFENDSLSQANAIALTADGKIIAAGISQLNPDKKYFAVIRYNRDGSLDDKEFNPEGKGCPAGMVRTTFGGAVCDDEAYAVAIQPNGKIVVGGSSRLTGIKTFALARYNTDGSVDKSFFSPGFARYNGTVVTHFACGETEGSIRALIIQSDGKIIAGGSSNSNSWRKDVSHFALARYDNRGILDENFGGYGAATVPGTVISNFGMQDETSKINALALQGDGKIVAAGMISRNGISNFALARYTIKGKVDCQFNDGPACSGNVITSLGGRKSDEIFALALQNDGDIVAAGTTDVYGRPQGVLARYLTKDILVEPAITFPAHNSVIVNGAAVKINGISQNPGILKIFVDENLVGSCMSKGGANLWDCQLPPLASGNHTVKILELYKGGNVSLMSQPITFVIDQHPQAVNATVTTCGLHPVCGCLDATGASGFYAFAIISTNNGCVILNGNEYIFTPSIAAGQGSFDFEVVDLITQCKGQGTITVIINDIPAGVATTFTTCPDSTFTCSLAQYVSGTNAPFTFEQIGQASNGAVELKQDGTFTFIPLAGFNGSGSFQYQITDAKGCISDPITVNIIISQPVIAQDTSFTTHESEAISTSLLNLVSGGSGRYRFKLINNPSNCSVVLRRDGQFTLTPKQGFNGTVSFTYQVTDLNQCKSNIATISVTIFESPAAANGQFAVCQNGYLSPSLTNLVNKGTPPYIFSQVGAATHGVAIVNSDGSFIFTPDTDFVGQASFAYQVTDQNNSISNTATITITVNELPVGTNASFETCQDTLLIGSLVASASGGSTPYLFSLSNSATNGSIIINPGGSFTFIPDQGFNGISNFTYTFTDANGCTSVPAQGTISVWENPSVQSAAVQTCVNRPISGSLSQLITGGLQPYNCIGDQAENGAVSVNVDGSYIFTAAQDFVGTATFTYHVTDAHQCASKTGIVTITVNPSPSVLNTSVTTIENVPITGSLAVLARRGIPPYIFNAVGESVNGNVTLNADGTYKFIPSTDYFGQASFAYQVTDVHGCISNTAQVTIKIFDLPKVQDKAILGIINTAISGSLASLVSGGSAPYQFQKVSDPSHGSLVLNNDGSYTYTPVTDYVGNDSFQYSVIDANHGNSNNGTISFTLYKPVSVTQQKEYTTCPNSSISGTVNDVVVDGQLPYTFMIANQTTHGTVELNADGSFVYVPTTGFNGTDSFQYTVQDSAGNNASGTVSITIWEGPLASEKIWTIFESESLQDSVTPLISGGKLPYTVTLASTVLNGNLQLNSDGTFTYVPTAGFIGTDSFQYTVTDANGCLSATAQASINVVSVPKAQNGTVIGITNSAISGSLASLVTAGTPPYNFQKLSDGSHGTVVVNNDGSYIYTPVSDYVGTDSFNYSVTDANNGNGTGQVNITIVTKPVINGSSNYQTCQNNTISGNVSNAVSNGVSPYLSALVSGANNGKVIVNNDGSFTYTPNQGFTGTDTFQYSVTDAIGTMVQGSVSITVNQAPVAQDKTWEITTNNLSDTLSTLATGGTAPYQFVQVGSAANGTAVVNADGTFNFESSIQGISNFTYQVTDANNCTSNIGTITIDFNPNPKVKNSSFETFQDKPLSGSLVSLMVGDNAPPYNFKRIGKVKNGTLVLHKNGSFIFTPNPGFVGVASFDFVAKDKNGKSSAVSTVNIMVNEDVVSAQEIHA